MKQLLSRNDAVFIGLAAMLGAGVFVVWGDVARLAGPFLLVAVAVAGLVAYLNAMTISQLSAKVPGNGGTYVYAREYLNPTYGFLAGMAFLIGKIGSAAAIALTFGRYLAPGFEVPVALGAVGVMTAVNLAGINRTAFGSKVLASITLLFLGSLIVASFLSLRPTGSGVLPAEPGVSYEIGGVFAAASLLFFAFAGYARVATLAGEVTDSARSVPSAIRISLAIVFAIYLLLAIFLPQRLGTGLALSTAPLADLAEQVMPWLPGEVVVAFAGMAALGSLLALLAGMSRTAASMAGDGELPRVFTRLNNRNTPWIAELLIASLVVILLSTVDLLSMVGLSSFCILLYYAIANLAAMRQPQADSSGRPKFLNLLGLLLSVAVGIAVPTTGLILGAGVLAIALGLRWGLARLNRLG
jgi:APA family basic amino acid/polyamine antiporter